MKKIYLLMSLFFAHHIFASDTLTKKAITVNPEKPLYQKDIYIDSASKLILKEVFTIDSVSVDELKTRVKNWGAIQFNNFSKVLISESENQIVLVYINSAKIGDWYIRTVLNFKDNKLKVEMYDDGNVYIPPSQYSAGMDSRSAFVSIYFNKTGYVPYTKKIDKSRYEGIVEWHNNVLRTTQSLFDNLKTSDSDDW